MSADWITVAADSGSLSFEQCNGGRQHCSFALKLMRFYCVVAATPLSHANCLIYFSRTHNKCHYLLCVLSSSCRRRSSPAGCKTPAVHIHPRLYFIYSEAQTDTKHSSHAATLDLRCIARPALGTKKRLFLFSYRAMILNSNELSMSLIRRGNWIAHWIVTENLKIKRTLADGKCIYFHAERNSCLRCRLEIASRKFYRRQLVEPISGLKLSHSIAMKCGGAAQSHSMRVHLSSPNARNRHHNGLRSAPANQRRNSRWHGRLSLCEIRAYCVHSHANGKKKYKLIVCDFKFSQEKSSVIHHNGAARFSRMFNSM